MKPSRTLQCKACLRSLAVLPWIAFCFISPGRAQTATANDQSAYKLLQEMNSKYPGLLTDLGHLLGRLQNDIHYPAPRSESRMLALLPESTVIYAAIPNYGDAAHQAAEILRSEVKDRAALRNWIAQNPEWNKLEPTIEDSLEKFSQVQAYLGDEVAFYGSFAGKAPAFLAIAEVRKPGVQEFLEKTVRELSAKSKPGVRILMPQQLVESASKPGPGNPVKDELLVLVRPDFVVAASEMTALRNCNEQLERRGGKNAVPSAFQERLGKEYASGTSTLAAADLHRLFAQQPPIAQPEMGTLQRNGFSDLQYLIWNRKTAEQETFSDAELSFAAPRRSAAAWLGNSRRLTTLDFVSPQATMSLTLVLRDPAQIFEEIRTMSGPNQNAFTSLAQFEQMLKVSLKGDILANLTGEATLELDAAGSRMPAWRVILGTKDSEHVRQTFDTLLAASPFAPQRFEREGVSYTSIEVPQGAGTSSELEARPAMKIVYAFSDGRLIFGSGSDTVAQAIRLHHNGESLEKSQTLLAHLPPGRGLEASGLFFHDPAALWSLELRRLSPELANAARQLLGQGAPSATIFYGDDKSIRVASRSTGMDVTTTLLVAAITIPNLLRSRMAANEASAVGSLRTINTAEVVYASAYPTLGFAPKLSKLGPNRVAPDKPTAEHADLIDQSLAGENCTPDGWCIKSGYRFNLKGAGTSKPCIEYAVTATPTEANRTGMRSFCSTSDGIIRVKQAGPLTTPLAAAECKTWQPIQ